MKGWVKVYRKLEEDVIFDNPKGLKIWIWCLLKASHKRKVLLVGRIKVKIQSGQFIFGRSVASQELRMSGSTIYFWIKFLKVNSYIDIKTTNKYSVISIKNWEKYQSVVSKVVNKKTTKKQQKDTYKNVKNNITNKLVIGDTRHSTVGRKNKSNILVNHVLTEFEKILGFKPTDRYPRRPAWNIIQRFKTFLKKNNSPYDDETVKKAISHYFAWSEKQNWAEGAETMDVFRRKTNIYFAEIGEVIAKRAKAKDDPRLKKLIEIHRKE